LLKTGYRTEGLLASCTDQDIKQTSYAVKPETTTNRFVRSLSQTDRLPIVPITEDQRLLPVEQVDIAHGPLNRRVNHCSKIKARIYEYMFFCHDLRQ
jgi:hypothetical protein